MLWTICVILLVLWALGFFGRPGGEPIFGDRNSAVHSLLVVVLVLVALRLLGII